MTKDDWTGIIIILGILAVAIFGGSKGAGVNGLFSTGRATPVKKEVDIQKQINQTKIQVADLQKKIQAEEDKKTHSEYYGMVKISFINKSKDPSQEYVTLKASSNINTPILVTGWTLKSTSSGASVSIPKGTYLYFSGNINSEEDIYLISNETLYLTTGHSPIGYNIKINKCSGYLTQFQKFIPYVNNICPSPKKEDLSSIPGRVINDACFDYINTYPVCRAQVKSLPTTFSAECRQFIYDKLNYPSCVNTHKNDTDFYQKEWRVFLKRGEKLWKDKRENVVLYDNLGKIVSNLSY